MIKRIAAFIIDISILWAVFLFSLISPYKYEWDETIKQVNSDKVPFLTAFWAVMGVFVVLVTIFKNKADVHVLKGDRAKWYSLAFGCAAALCCVFNFARFLIAYLR